MSGMGYNGAAFVSDKEREEITNILNKFQKATNRVLRIEQSTFECGGLYDESLQGKQTGFIINGKEFRKSPCTETWGGYVGRIKSYLFDLIMED